VAHLEMGAGWFQSETLRDCGFGTTPRVIAAAITLPS